MTTVGRLFSLLAGHRRWMAIGAALGFLAVGSNVALMAMSAYLISKAALVTNVAEVALAITAVRVLAIARATFRYLERYVTHRATFAILADLRVWFFASIEPLAPANLARHRSGDLLGRIVADIETLEDFYVRVLMPPVVAVLVAASCRPAARDLRPDPRAGVARVPGADRDRAAARRPMALAATRGCAHLVTRCADGDGRRRARWHRRPDRARSGGGTPRPGPRARACDGSCDGRPRGGPRRDRGPHRDGREPGRGRDPGHRRRPRRGRAAGWRVSRGPAARDAGQLRGGRAARPGIRAPRCRTGRGATAVRPDRRRARRHPCGRRWRPVGSGAGRIRDRGPGRPFSVRRRCAAGPRRGGPVDPGRLEPRDPGAERCRQVDSREPPAPVLGLRRRGDPDRRSRRARAAGRRGPSDDRGRAAGHPPVQRHDPGQPRGRRCGGDRRTDRRGVPGRADPRRHRGTPGRIRDASRRERPAPVGWRAPAARHRQGRHQGRPDPHPR